jgi:hypothetical protein
VGSVKLTAEIERIILAYIEAGSADYIAAEAAGIDQRTFRDYVTSTPLAVTSPACSPFTTR